MKLLRLLIILMIIVFWAIAPSPEHALAQSDGLVSISPAQSEVAVGSQVTLEFVLTDGENVNAFDMIVTYNPDLLSLTNWAYGDFLSNLVDVTEEDDPGQFHLVATQLATPPVSGDGVLLEITFQGLANGVSAITITRAELAESQGNKMLPAVRDGSVAVGDAQANPATATPARTQTQAPTNAVATTATPSRTPTPTNPSASTGYPDSGTPTRAPTRTPSGDSGYPAEGTPTTQPGSGTTSPGTTATSPSEATPEQQEADATRAFTPTAEPQGTDQDGVVESSPTEAGEGAPPAEESTPTQADPGQEPSASPAQEGQGLPLGLWLAMGLGLIVLGGGAFVLLRRQREKNYKEDLL